MSVDDTPSAPAARSRPLNVGTLLEILHGMDRDPVVMLQTYDTGLAETTTEPCTYATFRVDTDGRFHLTLGSDG